MKWIWGKYTKSALSFLTEIYKTSKRFLRCPLDRSSVRTSLGPPCFPRQKLFVIMLLNANKMPMLICRDTLPFKMKPVFPEKDPRCSFHISGDRLKLKPENVKEERIKQEEMKRQQLTDRSGILFWCVCHVRIWCLAPSNHKWSLLLLFPSQLITLIFCFLREILKMLTWKHHVYNLHSHLLRTQGSAPNLSWDWMCVKERAQLIDDGDCSSVIVKTQWHPPVYNIVRVVLHK